MPYFFFIWLRSNKRLGYKFIYNSVRWGVECWRIKCGLAECDRGPLSYGSELRWWPRRPGNRLWLLFEGPTLSGYVRHSIAPASLNNPPSSILRLSYSSRGVKDVYCCFCFILRSLLQPQYIKHLRRPHRCRTPSSADWFFPVLQVALPSAAASLNIQPVIKRPTFVAKQLHLQGCGVYVSN